MQSKISRRAVVIGGLIAGALIPAMGLIASTADAAEFPPLDPSNSSAKAMGFVPDAGKVDTTANPTYNSTQKCGTCVQFQGKAGNASAGCNLFPGRSVPQGGWCKAWMHKPAA